MVKISNGNAFNSIFKNLAEFSGVFLKPADFMDNVFKTLLLEMILSGWKVKPKAKTD